jgi:hypothetical protein
MHLESLWFLNLNQYNSIELNILMYQFMPWSNKYSFASMQHWAVLYVLLLQLTNLPQRHLRATLNIYIYLTVTCSSIHAECIVMFPLQQWFILLNNLSAVFQVAHSILPHQIINSFLVLLQQRCMSSPITISLISLP